MSGLARLFQTRPRVLNGCSAFPTQKVICMICMFFVPCVVKSRCVQAWLASSVSFCNQQKTSLWLFLLLLSIKTRWLRCLNKTDKFTISGLPPSFRNPHHAVRMFGVFHSLKTTLRSRMFFRVRVARIKCGWCNVWHRSSLPNPTWTSG
jgi:hypothetical protein